MWAITGVVLALVALAAATRASFLREDPASLAWWWLTNVEPPAISLAGPSASVRSVAMVQVDGPSRDRVEVIEAYVDGQSIPPDLPLLVDTQALADGVHRLQVLVRDRSLRRNTARAELAIESDNTPPDVQVQLRPAAPREGRALVVQVATTEPASVSGVIDGRAIAFQQGNESAWAVVGFTPSTAPETAQLAVIASDAAGNTAQWSQTYDVARGDFARENLQVSPELEVRLTPDVRLQESALLEPIYSGPASRSQWEGRFMLPVDGSVVTPFGTSRVYNGRGDPVHHDGVDIAAPDGAEVRAANNGLVAFVGTLDIRGNTLVLDHGAGLYTTYAHLSQILLSEGQAVRRGDVVAKVGTTGVSTGPHLHWELWAGGASTDPWEWTERPIP